MRIGSIMISTHFISVMIMLLSGFGMIPRAFCQTMPEGASRRSAQLSDRFHLNLAYGIGQLEIEVDGDRSLPATPVPGTYEDNQPVSGSFHGGSCRYQRTTLAYLFPFRRQVLFAGMGLENLTLGEGSSPLTKSGGTAAEFQLNALALEFGAVRKLNPFSLVKGMVAYDHFLDGKLRSRYLVRSASSSTAARHAVVEDDITGGGRILLAGTYYFNLTPGLSTGLQVNLQYGLLKFKQRSETSALFGYTFGLHLLLRI
jgi:hypothetical protein